MGQLSYYDHYAEGVLYKLSKKSRPYSLLTGYHQPQHLSAKESSMLLTAGVWKERWVVLQGTKLLIYHKRKVEETTLFYYGDTTDGDMANDLMREFVIIRHRTRTKRHSIYRHL